MVYGNQFLNETITPKGLNWLNKTYPDISKNIIKIIEKHIKKYKIYDRDKYELKNEEVIIKPIIKATDFGTNYKGQKLLYIDITNVDQDSYFFEKNDFFEFNGKLINDIRNDKEFKNSKVYKNINMIDDIPCFIIELNI